MLAIANPKQDAVAALLKADAGPVPQRGTSDPELLYSQQLNFQRAHYARQLLEIDGRKGLNGAIEAAMEMASTPPENPHLLP